ncbi:MAG: efflux RND transporter periplasmic adaptor subunit [Acidobacteriota bacterium]|nr:efflux RND transporter periplasmic adaptor subunit [Blastocatellia bacterium]MDW8239482.1 efflux RND transporter periplasmic adaptor subunit [Acidobacteriota bacterium]
MDIPRPSVARRKRLRRALYGLIGLGLIVLITVGVSRLKPAPPSVERATVWIDTVKRGPMLRQVRGLGTLVPEEIRWIPAATEGRVERRLVQPGAVVKSDTVLLELSNPELEQAALEAKMQLRAAEAEYTNLRVQLESQLLTQRAQAAAVQAEYHQAKLQAEANEELAKDHLISDLILKLSQVRAEELSTRFEIEQKRLAIMAESVKAQLAVQQARVEQLRALYELRRSQVEALHVRAGTGGVLQQVLVEVGQQVTPGTNLARVADPTRLMAQIRIPETQAKDVQIGQTAAIDTRNGIVPGRVVRIDPAVQNGTVTVDVALEGPLPKGSRPDLSVDGTIEIERLEDVLYVGRPAFGQEKSTVGLFKLINGGREAVRVPVKLGRSSVNTIEILDGLQPGDQVILSDMSAWDAFDRIRLN